MEPIDETESFLAKVSDAVGASQRRRVEQDSGSPTVLGISHRKPLLVVGRPVLSDGYIRRVDSESGIGARRSNTRLRLGPGTKEAVGTEVGGLGKDW